MRHNKGFTLIEAIMVIVILSILVTVAASRFVDIRRHAQEASADAIIGAVKEGIRLYKLDEMVK